MTVLPLKRLEWKRNKNFQAVTIKVKVAKTFKLQLCLHSVCKFSLIQETKKSSTLDILLQIILNLSTYKTCKNGTFFYQRTLQVRFPAKQDHK